MDSSESIGNDFIHMQIMLKKKHSMALTHACEQTELHSCKTGSTVTYMQAYVHHTILSQFLAEISLKNQIKHCKSRSHYYKLWGHADLIYNCLCMHACMQGVSYSAVTSCCPNSYISRLDQFTIHEMLNFQDGKRDYNSVLSLKNASQTSYRHSHNMFAIPSKWWHYYTYELRPCCYAVDIYIHKNTL